MKEIIYIKEVGTKGDGYSAIIEPLLKDQWFLDVKDMAKNLLEL